MSRMLLGGALGLAWGWQALAAITPAQAQQLGSTLTEFGAIKAGSADGAIPPYTGGINAMSGLPAAGPARGFPDPFAGEKPLFSINSKNLATYASQVTPGVQALLRRYPEYRLDVYPTHRTASYPAWVLRNTVKNATTAQMIGEGDGVTGAYGGIPFPVPKDGYEAMWSSFLQYEPASCSEEEDGLLVDSSGGTTNLGRLAVDTAEPYYNPDATALPTNFYRYFTNLFKTPIEDAGDLLLFEFPIDFTKTDDVTYVYTPGTRRVRVAPEFRYDTPAPSYGGAIDFDEINLFYGRMDKFSWHLLGRREMIAPYDDYKFANASQSELIGPHTLNPDGVRWERHRVWVVEATLKPGARHVVSRWDFYIDEDSWHILATETYDHAGDIYRIGLNYPWQNYGQGGATTMQDSGGVYDMSKAELHGLADPPQRARGRALLDATAQHGRFHPARHGRGGDAVTSVTASAVRMLAVAWCFAPCAGYAGFADPLFTPAIASRAPAFEPMMAITPAGDGFAAAGARGVVIVSGAAGRGWAQAATPVQTDLTSVDFPTKQDGWACGHDGVILHTRDGGRTWTKQLDGIIADRQFATFYAREAAAGVKEAASSLRQIEQNYGNGPSLPWLGIRFRSRDVGFVVGSFGDIARTQDGGQTWEPWLEHIDDPDALNLNALAIVGRDLYIVGEQGMVFVLDEARNRFVARPTGYAGSLFGLTGDDRVLVAFGMRGSIFRSTDHGLIWRRVRSPSSASIMDGAVSPGGSIALVATDGSVLLSGDDGATFTLARTRMAAPLSGIAPAGEGEMILTSLTGIHVVKD